MTLEAEAIPHAPPAERAAPGAALWARQYYWSVRRELWEHGSLWIAPLAIAGVSLFGFLFGARFLPQAVRLLPNPALAHKAAQGIAAPYEFIAFALVINAIIVSVVYCLGALQNERRDRSILFWKSLPVSDLTTVLSKATVPLILLPLITFVVVVAGEIVVLGVSTLVVAAAGLDVNTLWAHTPFGFVLGSLVKGLPGIAIWYAPLFGWLLLVSAWARRVPYLWAFAAPLLLGLVEQLAFGTTLVWRWLALRIVGVFLGSAGRAGRLGFGPDPTGWDSPHVWIGLVLAAAFLAGAVWLRRSREPI
jgi:ABC-2 type transport system permease protein